jgi:hypothetical protein
MYVITRDHSASGAVDNWTQIDAFSVFYYERRPNPKTMLYFRVNNGFKNAWCSITKPVPKTIIQACSVVFHVYRGLMSCTEPSSFWFLISSICNLTTTFHGEVQQPLFSSFFYIKLLPSRGWFSGVLVPPHAPLNKSPLLSLAPFWKQNKKTWFLCRVSCS